MTVKEFKEIMVCNEPVFEYNGKIYSICSPDGRYYARVEDEPADVDHAFDSVEELLDNWLVDGRPFREIVSDIE